MHIGFHGIDFPMNEVIDLTVGEDVNEVVGVNNADGDSAASRNDEIADEVTGMNNVVGDSAAPYTSSIRAGQEGKVLQATQVTGNSSLLRGENMVCG